MDVEQRPIWELQVVDLSNVDTIARALDLDENVARLLVQRGIRTIEEARRFLCPAADQLHDPFLLPDAEIAIDRLLVAVERGERIAIHGDYDVDGVTATVLLRRVLDLIGADVFHFIPHRLTDGYGLQTSGIDRLHQEGATVVVTVDCGIRSLGAAERARALNIDLIVTDHHEPGDVLPDALAVINPRRKDANYPFRDLSGAGISFKLAQGICKRLNRSEWVPALMKIAAIGTVADVVCLQGENRTIAKLGLDGLTAGRHTCGLEALLEVSKLAGKRITSEDVGF
ncbi:MAG: single-stranded-DNA-specific exonuclease RecJ, partial [Vicinamibacterales bacterium]